MLKKFLRMPLLTMFLVGIAISSIAQTTGDYRSNVTSGNWSTLASWQRYNGASWATPTAGQGYPGQNSSPSVAIQTTHTITLDVTPVNNISSLSLASGGFFGPAGGALLTSGNPSLTVINNITVGDFAGITFGGSGTLTVGVGVGTGIISVGGIALFNRTGTGNTTCKALNINSQGYFAQNSTGSLTVSGTSQMDGSFQDTEGTGVTTFTGSVTVTGTGTTLFGTPQGFTSTSVTTAANMIFQNGIDNSGTFNAGAATFNTNSQSLTGTGAMAFANNVAITGVTVTNSNTGAFTITGTTTLTTSGGYTDSNNTSVATFVGNLSVGSGTSFVSITVSTTANLVFRGGIANVGTFTAGGVTFDTNNQALTGAGAMSFANNVAVTGVTVTNSNTGAFTITGTTALTTSGGYTDTNNTSVATFVGNVSVGSGTSFISTTVSTTANLVFRGGIANAGTFTAGGATFNTNNQGLTGAGAMSFANNVDIASITVTNSNTGAFTVTGTTTLTTSGGYTDSNNTSVATFVGNVSVGSGTSFISTTVSTTANLVFRGGIANAGTFTAGGATFDTNNQALTGAGAMSFANNVAITGVTVTNSNTGAFTITGTTALTTSGGYTDTNNTSVATFVGNVSVGSGTSFISTTVSTTANLVFRGGIANAGTFTAGGATFNTNNQGLTGAGAMSFANNVAITGVTVTNSNTGAFTVTGTTALTTSGGCTDTDNTSVSTFVGNVSVGSGTSFISTTVSTTANLVFRGGIANAGTFTAGGATFNTNDQALTGTGSMSFANNVAITTIMVTNSNTNAVSMTSTAAAVLSGTGIWSQDVNSILNYAGSTLTVATFDASNSGNTVNYNGAAATIRDPAISWYYHLTLSGTGIKASSADHTINGNLSIYGSAQFDASANNIYLGGDWTVTSSNIDPFVEGTKTVTLNGTTTQTITTSLAAGETFYKLIFIKSSSNVSLAKSITVTQQLTLINGNLNLNGNTLTITNTATTAISRTNGYIISEKTGTPYAPVVWTMGTTTGSHTFPFGTAGGSYIPFVFNITAAGVGASGQVSVATYPTGATNTPFPSGVANVNKSGGTDNSANTVDRFWIITPVGYTSNPTVTATFTATSAEVGSITTLRAQRWNGTTWDPPIASQTNPTAYSATVPGITTFSPWTLSGNNIALPIELTWFNATEVNSSVLLEWETESEVNNESFAIERSPDGFDFMDVDKLAGAGTSAQKHNYSYVDEQPLSGTSYYRLRQIDFDGTSTYSHIVFVKREGELFSVYPNPACKEWVTFSRKVNAVLLNNLNQVVATYKEATGFSTSNLVSGVYIIRTQSGEVYQLVIR